ncbi:MAG: putative toxin-antitoxin system toxin component, PIN family, partial [Microcystis panniformis]
MRVVVDTNILVSFAIRPNENFERMFDFLARQGIILISDDTVAELFTVLNREKFRKYIRQDSAMDYIEWYVSISESVIVTESVIAC